MDATTNSIASRAQAALQVLSESGLWTSDRELLILLEAVAAGRRAGEIDGFISGQQHMIDFNASITQLMTTPISAAEVKKASEP